MQPCLEVSGIQKRGVTRVRHTPKSRNRIPAVSQLLEGMRSLLQTEGMAGDILSKGASIRCT